MSWKLCETITVIEKLWSRAQFDCGRYLWIGLEYAVPIIALYYNEIFKKCAAICINWMKTSLYDKTYGILHKKLIQTSNLYLSIELHDSCTPVFQCLLQWKHSDWNVDLYMHFANCKSGFQRRIDRTYTRSLAHSACTMVSPSFDQWLSIDG